MGNAKCEMVVAASPQFIIRRVAPHDPRWTLKFESEDE